MAIDLTLKNVVTRLTFFTPAFSAGTATGLILTNQANTDTMLGSSSRFHQRFDATNYTQVRVTARVTTGSASANSPRLTAKYSTDNGANFTTIGTGSGSQSMSMSAGAVNAASDWIDLPEGAKADVVFGIGTNGGDGTADPELGNIVMEFR